MPAWFAPIVAWLVKNVATYFIDAWKQLEKIAEAYAEIERDTKKQADDLKNSVTDEEDEKAAQEILSRKQ